MRNEEITCVRTQECKIQVELRVSLAIQQGPLRTAVTELSSLPGRDTV